MNNFQKHDNGDHGMQTPLRLTLAATAIAALFGAAPAYAEPLFQSSLMPKVDMSRWNDNYIELGVGGVSTDAASNKSFKFGEFTGLRDEDAFAIVGFNWIFNSRENDARYLRTHASNLGLETRKFAVEGGKQGSWDLSFSADRLLRSEIDSARFVHNGLGSNTLTNPAAGVVGSAATAPLYLKGFDIEQGRDIYRLGLHGILGANWDYKISYREDNRDGTRLTGLPFGTGTIQAAIVPYEINDKTQQVEATLGYLNKAIEGQLSYSYSRYENSLDRFRVENPNGNTNPVAQMSLMPDNEYHQLNLTGAYNFSRNTRAKALLSYGVATQNEAFLPYNSAGAGITSGTLLPAKSLHGKMINTVADLALMTKPLEAMDLKFAYQYRDVDNQTPRNSYLYAGRDGAQPVLPLTAATAAQAAMLRTTAPVSTTEQKLVVDGDYHFSARTQLRALLEHTITDYTLSDRKQTKTNKAALDLRRTFSDEFLGNVGYAFTQRTGSVYDKNTYFRETYTGPFVASATQSAAQIGTLTNHPSMRSFLYNDFDENRVKTSGSWTASETLTAGASVDGYDRVYKGDNCGTPVDPTVVALLGAATLPDTCLGTQKALGGNATIDLQWQPDEDLMAFTFYTLAQTKTEIDGRGPWSKGTNLAPTPTLNNTLANWYGSMIYTDQTVGIGARWQTTPKLELGGQYAYAEGIGKTSIKSNTAGAASPLPELESTVHNVNLYAKWLYSSKLTFRFNYLFEHLVTKDWAYDGFTPTTNTGLLMTGQTSANYKNHVIAVSVALSTW